MDIKTGVPIRIKSLSGLLLFFMLFTAVWANTNSKSNKEPPRQPLIIISGQLNFELSGAPGEYREIKPVIIKVHQSAEYIRFSAGPFFYVGRSANEKQVLKAVYWIDHPQQSFDSGKPLILHTGVSKRSRKSDYFEMRLYGKVTIDKISAQPAGKYGGKIMVTVTDRL
ncbi:MAG: hypothetical protein GX075_04655 [Firmicutes bacterium]|nr:hypothetical protein [Bacillota bacterium]